MENHNRYGVCRTDSLYKCAGVDPWVILQTSHMQVGHDGDKCQHPYQEHAAQGVLVAIQLIILETVADVAVAVNGNSGDVEY